MKLDEFRKLLKPMVKEMIKEALIEEGVLSSIVSEVAQGLVLAESKSAPPQRPAATRSTHNEALEAARRDLQATKSENRHIFEGTQPTPSGGGGPMSGTPADDPGVDLNRILGGKRDWSKLI